MRSLKETIKVHSNERKQKILQENHTRILELFEDYNLNEGDDVKRNLVIEGIENGDWIKPNPKMFKNSLEKSKYLEMLTIYSVSEFSEMRLYQLSGYEIGYAIKKRDGKFNE